MTWTWPDVRPGGVSYLALARRSTRRRSVSQARSSSSPIARSRSWCSSGCARRGAASPRREDQLRPGSQAEPASYVSQQLTRVDPDLSQQVVVLFGVDLVWKLLISLIRLVVITTVTEQLKNLIFGNLHVVLHRCGLAAHHSEAPVGYCWAVCLTVSALSWALAFSASACC